MLSSEIEIADKHRTLEVEAAVVNNDDFSRQEEKKIIRRVDLRLVATCGVMFCFSLMDRGNLGAAAIAGMAVDLKLIDYRYSIIALIFFVTYVAIQPFANVVCRKVGPRAFLGFITVTWGICMICFGFPNTWGPMIALRLILGALEGGFFPACLYLISMWYTRYEIHQRFSLFYVVGCFSSAFSGILAYGLMHMDGLAGLEGWRWIFIMEGIFTVIIGLLGYFIMVDFPDRASKSWKFLTERECQFMISRVVRDRADAEVPPFSFRSWAAAGKDWKIWAFAFNFFLSATVAYAIAFFMPIILRQKMGFSLAASQCLVAPPYVLASIQMYLLSLVGDKWHIRGPIIMFNNVVSLVGVPIMGFASSSGARYFGIFLVTAGSYANFPAIMAWQANNIRGHWKRAFSSAALVGIGSIGGVAGALVFRTQDAPSYHPGTWAIIACNIVALILTPSMSIYFRVQNRRADRGLCIIEGLEGFRYTI